MSDSNKNKVTIDEMKKKVCTLQALLPTLAPDVKVKTQWVIDSLQEIIDDREKVKH